MSRRATGARRGTNATSDSATAASSTRDPLKASGESWVVPYFTTLKLTPQMSAISTSEMSVSQTVAEPTACSARGAACASGEGIHET